MAADFSKLNSDKAGTETSQGGWDLAAGSQGVTNRPGALHETAWWSVGTALLPMWGCPRVPFTEPYFPLSGFKTQFGPRCLEQGSGQVTFTQCV